MAARLIAKHIIRRIAEGDTPPRAGLGDLMTQVYYAHLAGNEPTGIGHYVGETLGLQHLIGAFWGYSDLAERPDEISIDGRFGPDAVPLLDEQSDRLRARLARRVRRHVNPSRGARDCVVQVSPNATR
jgi:hypothetical protein